MNLRPYFALALALAAAACSSVNTVEPASPSGHPNRAADTRIITDSGLNNIAYVGGVVESSTGGLKEVQAQIRNLTSSVRNISYEFTWYDNAGILIDSPSNHRIPTQIEGGASKEINSIAPSPKAVDWKLELQESVGY